MSVIFLKVFTEGKKVRIKLGQQDFTKTVSLPEELLLKNEGLKKKIDQELLFAKKNCRTNRLVALQALRRKKCYEEQLACIERAVQAVRFTTHLIDIVNKNEDKIRDLSDTFYTVEYDEPELLAELERLEEHWDELLSEDITEDTFPCAQVLSTASAAHPAKTEEEEIEDDLEYLRLWANATS